MRNFFSCLLSFLLASCVTLPSFDTDPLTPNDVVWNLRCQLAEAVRHGVDRHQWLKDYKASFILTLKVLKLGRGSADANLAIPLHPGLAMPMLALVAQGRASREMDFKVEKSVAELSSLAGCSDSSRGLLLRGDLGIRDYFDRIRYVNDDFGGGKVLTNSNYTVDFFVTKSATPSAKFSLIPIGERTFGANAKLQLEAQYTHTIKLTVTPPDTVADPEPVDPTEVKLVADDTGMLATIVALMKENVQKDLARDREQLRSLENLRDSQKAFPESQLDIDKRNERIEKLEESIRDRQKTKDSLERIQEREPSQRFIRRRRPASGLTPSERQRLRDGQTRSILEGIQQEIRSLEALQ